MLSIVTNITIDYTHKIRKYHASINLWIGIMQDLTPLNDILQNLTTLKGSCITAVYHIDCRYVMGLGKYAPNIAVQGDMGLHLPYHH